MCVCVCGLFERGVLMKMLREGWERCGFVECLWARERGDLRGREKEGKRIIKEGCPAGPTGGPLPE